MPSSLPEPAFWLWWRCMELRQLRYFVAVAEEGNISRAAQKIFLTQPALSRQIKALEEEIGQCLLERQAHSIRLTRAGKALLREARELLEHAEDVLERVRAAEREVRLRVGYAPSLATGVLSPAVENFAQKHPTARVELFDLSTMEMLAGLESESLDIVLTVGHESRGGGLKWTPLVQAPWKLAVSRKHPLIRKKRLTPNDIAGESLLVFCRRGYPEYWETISEWFRTKRLRPKVAGEYDGAESLMAAVESGMGVALVTTRTAHLFPNRARFLTLPSPPKPLCISAGYRLAKKDDEPLMEFVEELRAASRAFV